MVDIKTLFTIKFNQLTMIRDRGYDLADEIGIISGLTPEQYGDYLIPAAAQMRKTPRQAMNRLYRHSVDGHILFVYYAENEKGSASTGVNEFANFVSHNEYAPFQKSIIITTTKFSTAAQKLFEEPQKFTIQHFLDEELMYNPNEHNLVPKHILIADPEKKKKIIADFGRLSNFPYIRINDPICKWHGWTKGQLIEIRRKRLIESLVQEVIYYRVVKK